MKYTKFISILKSFKDGTLTEPMVSLDNRFELSVLLRGIGGRVIFACFPRIVKLTPRLKQLKIFTKYLYAMTKHHGSTFTVKYLKLSALALQRYIAGSPASSYRELDSELPLPRLYNGLPRFIPIEDRRAIRRGDFNVIRGWLTMFAIYRVIKIPCSAKLATITSETSASSESLKMGALKLRYVISQFKSRFPYDTYLKKEVWLLPVEKASPLSVLSGADGFTAPKAIKTYCPQLYKDMLSFMPEGMGPFGRFRAYFEMLSNSRVVPTTNLPITSDGSLMIGKLSRKAEAAGKLRIFAMVDIWTQSMLKPLHDMLFDILKTLPNDATFDQTASVKRAADKAAKWGKSFGYDLSAATDRLPISLQISILSELIGDDKSRLGARILVDREYYLKLERGEDGTASIGKDQYAVLKYAVGQPMGALSSGAMLALTHHMIVQLSYRMAYPASSGEGYDQYELLGDDIVLFDPIVAKTYLELMSDYGVEINLSKSVIATNPSLEFAKVTIFKGRNVSAIPGKMVVSQRDRIGRINVLNYLLSNNSYPSMIRFVKNMTMLNPKEKGDYGFALISLLTMCLTKGSFTMKELLRTLTSVSVSPKTSYLKETLANTNIGYIESLLVSIYTGKPLILTKAPLVDMAFTLDHPHQKIALANDLLEWKFKSLEPYQLKDKLVFEIIDGLLPDLPDEAKILMWPHDRLVTEAVWDQRLFQSIYFTVDHWLKDLDQLWKDIYPGIATDYNIDRLLSLTEKRDSLLSLLKLVDRGKAKKADNKAISLPLKPSLKILQFLLKSYKDRPLWTYDIERMSHLRGMRISRLSFIDR